MRFKEATKTFTSLHLSKPVPHPHRPLRAQKVPPWRQPWTGHTAAWLVAPAPSYQKRAPGHAAAPAASTLHTDEHPEHTRHTVTEKTA